MGEAVIWCSYACGGAVAEHQVKFNFLGQDFTENFCDECLEEFLDNGPPEATRETDGY